MNDIGMESWGKVTVGIEGEGEYLCLDYKVAMYFFIVYLIYFFYFYSINVSFLGRNKGLSIVLSVG